MDRDQMMQGFVVHDTQFVFEVQWETVGKINMRVAGSNSFLFFFFPFFPFFFQILNLAYRR